MNVFKEYWDRELYSLSAGSAVTVGQLVTTIIVAIVGLYLSWLLQRFIGKRLAKANINPDVAEILKRISFIVILLLLFITLLAMLDIPITAFAFISGGVAIGVGFGAQSIINNLISGWILMSERPVRIGDFVEIDDSRGVVERIGNRSTRIKRIDGVHLLVPNSQMLERVVVNWTLIDRNFRTTVRVGVIYGSPVRKVEELLLQAATEHRFTLDEPPASVVFEDFGDNALIFDLYFWCESTGEREMRLIRSDIRFRIEELLAENKIEIAFPQRDIHLHTKKPIGLRIEKDVD